MARTDEELKAMTVADKIEVKAKMRELQSQRDRALDSHDGLKLKALRRQIHHLNHQIRAHMH